VFAVLIVAVGVLAFLADVVMGLVLVALLGLAWLSQRRDERADER
jgi:hypothetical protein